MAAETLQGNRGLRIIPSDDAEIPYPGEVAAGTNGSVVASKLVDPTQTFISSNVEQGDIVYNLTDDTAATVLKVETQHTILLNANIFTGTGKSYAIYKPCSPANGPCLYIGGTGTINGTTTGGDTLTYVGLPTGLFVPIHFTKIWATSTTATFINAVW